METRYFGVIVTQVQYVRLMNAGSTVNVNVVATFQCGLRTLVTIAPKSRTIDTEMKSVLFAITWPSKCTKTGQKITKKSNTVSNTQNVSIAARHKIIPH